MSAPTLPGIKPVLLAAQLAALLIIVAPVFSARAELPQSLNAVNFQTLPGNRAKIVFNFSGPALPPKVFHTTTPPRISIDFTGVVNQINPRLTQVNTGNINSIATVEAGGRTRAVISLNQITPYDVEIRGNQVTLSLGQTPGNASPFATADDGNLPRLRRAATQPDHRGFSGRSARNALTNVEFRRGDQGEGRVILTLSDSTVQPDAIQRAGQVTVTLPGTTLPPQLAKALDVSDFATPVKTVESSQSINGATVAIKTASPDFDYISYQTNNTLTLEFRPLATAEKEQRRRREFTYTGERLSLNFRDIPVRSVLQVIADFNGKNIVASDSVAGNITLRLENVPWDQALAIVLQAKGLGKREQGNVIWVAPAGELADRERQELESLHTVAELEPLHTEIFRLKYTTAAELRRTLTNEREERRRLASQFARGLANRVDPGELPGVGGLAGPGGFPGNEQQSLSLLSQRGTVTFDARTNTLIVRDIARNIEAIRELVTQLDVPVRQVLIESRIVLANDNFSRDLGARFAAQNINNPAVGTLNAAGQGANGFRTVFPAALSGIGGVANFQILRLGDFLLDLELSALESEGRGETISAPRIITADRQNAVIQQGQEIPFQTVSLNGTQTEFREAVLSLDVTPQITPENDVIMELRIRNDQPNTSFGLAAGPVIDTREVRTHVRVNNGETVVLGGVFVNDRATTISKVPFFGDLPGVGVAFRRKLVTENKNELLVFITPKVLRDNLVQNR